MTVWHSVSPTAATELLAVDSAVGLTTDEAARRRLQTGENVLTESAGESWQRRLLRQFQDLVIGILIAAAVVAGVMGEWANTSAILAIVFLNGVIGFLQEARAERALAALRRMAVPMARVQRDGRIVSLPTAQLVPGDIVLLEAGDHIPADCRLLTSYVMQVQEAALTGESAPVEKSTPENAVDTVLGDRTSMVHFGTVVAAGRGTAVVTATGMRTELGRIAGLLQRAVPDETPLQRQLASLGHSLALLCLALVLVIFVTRMLRGDGWVETLLLSVSLAVAAIPEGLPAVVTLTLALGLQRMAARRALVRRLPGVETLGAVTVICTDKTGTLTRGEMTVREVATARSRYLVTGAGTEPRGEFQRRDLVAGTGSAATEPAAAAGLDADLQQLLTTGIRCNNAAVNFRDGAEPRWELVGDPTEGALLVAGMKAGLETGRDGVRLLLERPFDSERRLMSVIARESDGRVWMHVKGAPEAILERCRLEQCGGEVRELTEERRRDVQETSREMAGRALRMLGLAFRVCGDQQPAAVEEADLVFVGLAGIMDPPREEAREALQNCRAAGIRVVMITGDHPETAQAIGTELGITDSGQRALTGRDLDELSDEQLRDRAGSFRVFARVTAEHKLRIVSALRAVGETVAMTGDGVNDAPAIRAADIGVSMGLTGTDVTREASDMVLMDDNFASIVSAVEEGRGIFDSIRRSIQFLLTGNSGEMLLMLTAAAVGWPAPLIAIQILWINLVSDGLPALALGLESPEASLMQQPPRQRSERLLGLPQWGRILVHGCILAVVAALGFAVVQGDHPESPGNARATAFGIMAFSQLLLAFGFRSRVTPLVRMGVLSNPWLLTAIVTSALLQFCIMLLPGLRTVFGIEAALTWQWCVVLGLSPIPLAAVELEKVCRRR
ncbi:MAG: cation-translocating P-type ATPase [Planctomycetota bacterium]